MNIFLWAIVGIAGFVAILVAEQAGVTYAAVGLCLKAIYTWLNDDVSSGFATLIGALVGFGGVIATLFVNAWLTRKRDKKQRDEEAAALAAVLMAEIDNFVDEARALGRLLAVLPTDKARDHYNVQDFAEGEPARVFRGNIDRIDLVGGELGYSVVNYHKAIERLRRNCLERSGRSDQSREFLASRLLEIAEIGHVIVRDLARFAGNIHLFEWLRDRASSVDLTTSSGDTEG